MQIRKILPMFVLMPALLAPLHGTAEVAYTINLLPKSFSATDINNAGQISGSISNELGAHAAVFSGGIMTDLGTFSGMFSQAEAINESGVVVGNSGLPRGPWNAFIFGNGTSQEILGMYGNAINAGGDIAGYTHSGSGAMYSQGTMTTMGYLGTGASSTAAGINTAGHVVGTSNIDLVSPYHEHPYMYYDGTLHDLGTLYERAFNSAVAINDAGQIAGVSEGENGAMHAYLYEHGAMVDLGTLGGTNLWIGGMNAYGDIVGNADNAETSNNAFVSRGGALVNLNTLIDPASGWRISDATGINDLGQIVATACRDDGCMAVRLDLASAVPEPSSILLSLFGLLMLASPRLRRHWRGTTAPRHVVHAGLSC